MNDMLHISTQLTRASDMSILDKYMALKIVDYPCVRRDGHDDEVAAMRDAPRWKWSQAVRDAEPSPSFIK